MKHEDAPAPVRLLLQEDSSGLDSTKWIICIFRDRCSVSCLSSCFHDQASTKMIVQQHQQIDSLQLRLWCNSDISRASLSYVQFRGLSAVHLHLESCEPHVWQVRVWRWVLSQPESPRLEQQQESVVQHLGDQMLMCMKCVTITRNEDRNRTRTRTHTFKCTIA